MARPSKGETNEDGKPKQSTPSKNTIKKLTVVYKPKDVNKKMVEVQNKENNAENKINEVKDINADDAENKVENQTNENKAASDKEVDTNTILKKARRPPNVSKDKINKSANKEDKDNSAGAKKRKRSTAKNKDVKKSKPEENIKWCSIRTRTSPRQMYLGVKGLSKKQRDAVRSMGFGKILSFQVDGIPSKLGHFVVDNFDPEEMAINLGSDIIKVDDDSIHQLLGVPNSGVILETLEHKRKFTGNAKSWKNMYEGSYVTTTQVVSRMHDNGDDDGIMFKLDFLTLFITTIVEAQDHGKCKLEFLHHINDDTDLSDINWCSYITRLIKNCKNGWKRCDKNSFFSGALTILVLLYVDRINVPPLNVERTTTPLNFWTMERLRSREKLEIKNGGFGKGCLRDQYLDLNGDESEDEQGNKDKPRDLTGHVTTLDALFKNIARDKKLIEKALCEACSAFPDIHEIRSFIDKYKSVFVETVDIEEQIAQSDWTQFVEENIGEIIAKVDSIGQKRTKRDKTEPSFSLGISSQESEDEPTLMCELVEINEPMTNEEQLVWMYMLEINKEKSDADKKKSPKKELSKTKSKGVHIIDDEQEQMETEGSEVQPSFFKDIFETGYGLQLKAYLMTHMIPGKQVYGNTIDCWAAVLNYQERNKSTGTPRRLFCYSSTFIPWMLTGIKTMESRSRAFKNNLLAVVDGQLDKMDLTSYDVIIFPMFEHHHFYLVCFDMNCPAIEVIDNMHKENCWVSLKDNPKFLSKGTPCKVRHIFSTYLKEVKHPKALSIPHVAPRRRLIDWGTRENFTDCGIFAMRHMEAYFGSSKPLDCGFNNKESEQEEQIKNLRMKYAAKILLSDANLLKRKVIEDARKVADKKKVA